MKIKVSELQGPALDWAVAKCENPEWSDDAVIVNVTTFDEYDGTICIYSSDWAQGGPIIERERITLDYTVRGQETVLWTARQYAFDGTCLDTESGPTPLIAAMRCYVASKMGDDVEVPDGLVKG